MESGCIPRVICILNLRVGEVRVVCIHSMTVYSPPEGWMSNSCESNRDLRVCGGLRIVSRQEVRGLQTSAPMWAGPPLEGVWDCILTLRVDEVRGRV